MVLDLREARPPRRKGEARLAVAGVFRERFGRSRCGPGGPFRKLYPTISSVLPYGLPRTHGVHRPSTLDPCWQRLCAPTSSDFVEDSTTSGGTFNVYAAPENGVYSAVLVGATAGQRADSTGTGLQTFGGVRALARYIMVEAVPASGGSIAMSEVRSGAESGIWRGWGLARRKTSRPDVSRVVRSYDSRAMISPDARRTEGEDWS